MKKLFCLIALIVPFSLFAAVKYPFPQNASYSYGIKASTVNSSKVQTAYNDFIKRFYEESGDKARIKWDTPTLTVSEGIGYGMLIMVYMDNETNKTQAKFDKLWKYYNSFLNDNGLMHWKINGFSSVAEQNGATDGDLDVAMALMQAYKQWGNESYLNDAKKLIGQIWKCEVNANKYLKPGDKFDSEKCPSYFSTAALEVFKNAGTQDWTSVINNCYSLIQKVRNPSTGLVPDWCSESGSPSSGERGYYKYDAARTPWRIAWGYLWYGHSAAKDICSKMSTWIKTKTEGNANSIIDGYHLDGSDLGSYCNSTFTGSFACAAMVDATHQAWLDKAYSKQAALVNSSETYYNASLRVIYLLLLTGNMPNFWSDYTPTINYTLTVSTTPSASGTVTISPSGDVFASGTQVKITPKAITNYKFVKWSGDVSSTDSILTVTMTKNMSITANFAQLEKFTLTVSSSNTTQGTVTISPTGTQFNSGTKVTLTAKPKTDFKFVNWSGDATGTDATLSVTMTKNMNITANFASQSAVINPLYRSGTVTALALSTEPFQRGKTITFAVPKAGTVNMSIYNIAGVKIADLAHDYLSEGVYSVGVKENLSRGTYWIRLTSSSGKIVQKLTISK